jgi:peptidoglycan/xylan/chitin deacetylase (PgdA/CDA1 family)
MIPILMYHQIDRIPPKVDANGVRAQFRSLIVSPASFARQMWLLNLLGYRGVGMGELMPYLRGEKTAQTDGKVVGITFDDGYQNNLVHALPTLQKYGFSSTCYAVSGLAGQSNVWDAHLPQNGASSGVQSKPLMTAQEMRQWIAGGQEIGSHTRHHVKLKAVDDATANIEIEQSKSELEAITGKPCEHFCYPYGQFDARHVALVKAAGYATATTTAHGMANFRNDRLELPRIGVMKNTNLFQFWRSL